MSNYNEKLDRRFFGMDGGIYLDGIECRSEIISATIKEWNRSCGSIDDLVIIINATPTSYDQRDNNKVYMHGNFNISTINREQYCKDKEPAPPIPSGLSLVLMKYDDGCGYDSGYALIDKNGIINYEETKLWLDEIFNTKKE